jgi:hypothetical protein
MDAITNVTLSSDEALFVETCLARRRELLALAQTAPVGHILRDCEEATVVIAQKIGSDLLTNALKQRVDALEEKKG